LALLATRCIHAAPLRAILVESSGARRGKREKVLIVTSVNYFFAFFVIFVVKIPWFAQH
jgi:hypothetical protein